MDLGGAPRSRCSCSPSPHQNYLRGDLDQAGEGRHDVEAPTSSPPTLASPVPVPSDLAPPPRGPSPQERAVRLAGGLRLAEAEAELRALMEELDDAGVPRRLVLRVEEVARWMAVTRADGAWWLAVGGRGRGEGEGEGEGDEA